MDYSKIRATWWSGTCYHLEQLNEIISSTDIRVYAYILHDKDKQEKSNEFKKPHYHFLVQFYQSQRGAWFKAFATDDMGIVFALPSYAPKGAFDYLTHDTPTARKQNKHLYDSRERISTIDTFETEDKLDENAELYTDLLELLESKTTWHELIKKKPKRIHMIANIKVAYDMLYFEKYRIRYFDTYIKPQKQYPTPPQKPELRELSPEEAEGLPW